MGNVDMTANQPFMAAHNKLVLQFIKCQPLFNVEDITFPLSTHGMRIVDATGRRVKLAGGNWSGGHLCRECVDGLEMRPIRDIAMDIRYRFKMNCIRLPYSLQLYFYNKVVDPKYLKANPELIGKTALEIFDITVKTLTDVGLMVILNNHTSTSMWCCSNDDGDGLWWTYEFPQYKFFQNCEEFAMRYKDNPRVIGMDLRNELRKAHGVLPTWGDGNPVTDWRRAAYICGERVLKVAPHWLILVGGLNYQLDLTYIIKNPLEYSVKNKLVYTGHFYGFSWPVPAWSLISYDSFHQKMFNTQTHVRGLGHPFFLGEFGNDKQDIPWKHLIRFLKETDIDWTYWALDGFKCDPDKDETYGMFTNDFKEPRHPEMLADLISVGPPPRCVISYPNKQSGPTKLQIKEVKKVEKPIQEIKIVNQVQKNKEKEQEKQKQREKEIEKVRQLERQKQRQREKQQQKQKEKEREKQKETEQHETHEIHEIPKKQKPKINIPSVIDMKLQTGQIKVQVNKQAEPLSQNNKSLTQAEKQKPKHEIFEQKYKN